MSLGSIFTNKWMNKLRLILGLDIWETYNLVIGGATTAPTKADNPDQDIATYQVVGKKLTIIYNYRSFTSQVGSLAGNGAYLFPIPAGIQIDTSLIIPSLGLSNQGSGCGVAWGGNQTAPAWGYMQVRDANNLQMVLGKSDTVGSVVSSSFFRINDGGVSYGFQVTLPIL